ncbi:tryptophan synthase alpha chain [Actinopolyspora lacussalsi]|nr:tryptophan synthase alpha chain [Actinopolyspora lacussalsi]
MTTTKPGSVLSTRLRRSDGGLALVPYLMAGHPDRNTTVEVGRRLAGSGAAVVELGMPYSDPLADGPVIQHAGQRALDAGTTTEGCLEVAAEIAAEHAAPVVLMTYLNPVLAYGVREFARDAAQAGVSGVILPDLAVEESAAVAGELTAAELDPVFLVAPTSSEERAAAICDASRGFVYAVTLTGITGNRDTMPTGVGDVLALANRHTSLPVAAGFGISTPRHLEQLRGHADAAVVGSAIVAEIEAGRDPVGLVKELLTACG